MFLRIWSIDNSSISLGKPSFIDCRMASAIDRPVFFAALRTSFSKSEGTASGYVSVFKEEIYMFSELFQAESASLNPPGLA